MAHVGVEARGRERVRLVGTAAEAEPRLAQAEQVEVVDQRGRIEEQRPAREVRRVQRERADRVRHGPDRAADRLPEPEQDHERERRQQHVGGPLGRLGDDARPDALEARARHAGVLHREQRQQPQIDREREAERAGLARVDRLRDDPEVTDERDRVQEAGEEQRVAGDAPGEEADALGHGEVSHFEVAPGSAGPA
jgi:hypothetical protein